MGNIMLLVLSIILILSSLSEKIEIIVHNEEVLLTLCFIAFIFFAYGYLSDGIVEDFQKKVEGLEDQLFGVLSEKFSATVAYFEELFLFKGLEVKILLVEILVTSRLFSHFFSFQTRALKEGINTLTTSKLMEVLRAESVIVEQTQKQTMKSVLISLILPASSFDYLKPLKQGMIIDDSSSFFAKISSISKL
jgi:hypothetical protein